MLHAKLGQNAG